MNKEISEIVKSIGSQEHEDMSKKILMVGTHQGASMVMGNLVKDFKDSVKEVMAKLTARPQRSYPQRPKKGRKRFN